MRRGAGSRAIASAIVGPFLAQPPLAEHFTLVGKSD